MKLDWNEYTDIARNVVAEGCVLLKNEENVLPLEKGSKVAVFGRIATNYYKSGTGSGGMVNVSRVIGVLDALNEEPEIEVDEELQEIYAKWEETHPFDEGMGWANEPWSQEEMPISKELAEKMAQKNDVAIIIIGRTAGEDKDNADKKGAYRLSDTEEDMIQKVSASFEKTVILYNIGGIMDMTAPCLDGCQSILYIWQGGMIGGLGVTDLLTGRVSPSGCLSDTIAWKIEDYPSSPYFGDEVRNYYKEDIYVGYRYFETVAKDKVQYPFGFGLSYTTFSEEVVSVSQDAGKVSLTVKVKNTGDVAGKHTVQVYVKAPTGKLGKPSRVLADFGKTKTLAPGEEECLSFTIDAYTYASYDDTGVTENAHCYVLEEGKYEIYAGANVRDAKEVFSYEIQELMAVEKLSQNLAPVREFQRMKENGSGEMIWENAPLGEEAEAKKRSEHLQEAIAYTGDQGIRLQDVAEGKAELRAFVAQLSDEELACMIRGEGMGSPRVTPGTAAAYGGVADSLEAKGIPCGCCSDGPSGMRIDSGVKAFSLPNGTLTACTFNRELMEELFACTGLEMRVNRIDNLLGPGMNIHRNPLNGRNFEYFSEDPLLTGEIAAAQLRGLHKSGVTGTIKHFATNNQETKRHEADAVVSERALREIYLKGFEIAVKKGNAQSVMTTYSPLNGVWTAGRYELNTAILRDEWGFDGIVMTDWWANINSQGKEPAHNDFASMARAQNDIYMVCPEGDKNSTGDNTLEALEVGTLTRWELQRNAMNICRQLMKIPAFARINGQEEKVEIVNRPKDESEFTQDDIIHVMVGVDTEIDVSNMDTNKGDNIVIAFNTDEIGLYDFDVTYSSELGELAQTPMSVYSQSVPKAVLTFNGIDGQEKVMKKKVFICAKNVVVRFQFMQNGVKVKKMQLHLKEVAKNIEGRNVVDGAFDMDWI